MEQMDLLQAFEIIVDKAKNSSLGEKFYEETDSYLGFVSDKLDISKRASAIMALFADRCDDNHIQFSDYTDFLDCRILSLLRYSKETEELVDKEYVCRSKDEGLYYCIPMEVMEAFQQNQRYIPSDVEELTTRELFDKFNELFTKCRRRKLDRQILILPVITPFRPFCMVARRRWSSLLPSFARARGWKVLRPRKR